MSSPLEESVVSFSAQRRVPVVGPSACGTLVFCHRPNAQVARSSRSPFLASQWRTRSENIYTNLMTGMGNHAAMAPRDGTPALTPFVAPRSKPTTILATTISRIIFSCINHRRHSKQNKNIHASDQATHQPLPSYSRHSRTNARTLRKRTHAP